MYSAEPGVCGKPLCPRNNPAFGRAVTAMTDKYCSYQMTNGRLCGRVSGHLPPHRSHEAVRNRLDVQKEDRRTARVKSPAKRRGSVPEVPAYLLPGSALASLAKYNLSGLRQPGDTLYDRIAYRMLERAENRLHGRRWRDKVGPSKVRSL